MDGLIILNFKDFVKKAKSEHSAPIPYISKIWGGTAWMYYAYISYKGTFIYTRSYKDYSFLKNFILREFGDFHY